MHKDYRISLLILGVLVLLVGGVLWAAQSKNSTNYSSHYGTIISPEAHDKSSTTLLKYAFWLVHKQFDYESGKVDILNQIANEFKSRGEDQLYDKVHKLYVTYSPKAVRHSYGTGAAEYNQGWFRVQDLVLNEGKYEEAVANSEDDPFALALIARNMYQKTEKKDRALEILNKAYNVAMKNSKDSRGPVIRKIIQCYTQIGRNHEAYQVFKDSNISHLTSSQSLPLVEYLTKDGRIDDALGVIQRAQFVQGKAKALITMAEHISKDEKLTKKQIQLLDRLLETAVSP